VAADRPNILFLHADQHRWDCLGANGHLAIRTPHLDRMAEEGVNFDHAFTPNPVCSPARACFLTGTWSSTHRCVTIPGTEAFQSADPALPVLTRLLADAGYRVGQVGKFHHEVRGTPTDHGVESFTPYFAYKKWREAQGLPPEPRTQGWFGELDPYTTPEQTSLHWQADTVLRLLETFRDPDRPFFIRWDPPEPHPPNTLPEPYYSLYPPETIPPWPSFPDPLENKPPAQRRTRQRWGTDGWGWGQWQPLVSRYLGAITLLDAQIGRLLDALDRLGIAENTLVIYSCDHGNMCGGHGMMDKHYVMYDDIMRVPLLVRWPGVTRPGTVCSAFVSQELDIAKTVLTAAGAEIPPSFVGRDLIAEAGGSLPDPRPDIFSQYMGTHQGLYSMRMTRDRRWKYVYNPAGIDELYDLEADPGEIANRVDDPDCAGTLLALRTRMGEWMAEVKDPLSPPLFLWAGATRGR
jgi:arylsulfatase A-like enzyme